MWDLKDLKPFSIYTLYSQAKKKKKLIWDLKPFIIYTLCSQEKNYVFNVGFEAL
jgi:hypothetical protein